VSDADFDAAQAVLAESIPGIAPDAVPRTDAGQKMYNVTVALAYDDDDQVVGAALTCRAQIAVQSMMLRADPFGFAEVLDKHSELDLLAVRPSGRGKGVGGALIEFLEARLVAAGVQVWFGNAIPELDVEGLRRFYKRHGFIVGAPGAPLGQLLGKSWTGPTSPPTAFYFHKALGAQATSSGDAEALANPVVLGSAPIPRVLPPDPNKARRPKKPKKKRRR
jgi:GNAT superfamily N-acetyltransferase